MYTTYLYPINKLKDKPIKLNNISNWKFKNNIMELSVDIRHLDSTVKHLKTTSLIWKIKLVSLYNCKIECHNIYRYTYNRTELWDEYNWIKFIE